jgi:hypothetical protein
MYLGRFQQGQPVRLAVSPVSGGNPATPDSAPVATVTGPVGFASFSAKLAMDGGPTAFALAIPLVAEFLLGTYSVSYSYSVGGNAGTASDTFDVIAGGDPGGRIISMTAYDRPEARYVVTQLSSGRIVQGRNPTI